LARAGCIRTTLQKRIQGARWVGKLVKDRRARELPARKSVGVQTSLVAKALPPSCSNCTKGRKKKKGTVEQAGPTREGRGEKKGSKEGGQLGKDGCVASFKGEPERRESKLDFVVLGGGMPDGVSIISENIATEDRTFTGGMSRPPREGVKLIYQQPPTWEGRALNQSPDTKKRCRAHT